MPLPNAVTATTVCWSGRKSGPPESPEQVPSPPRRRGDRDLVGWATYETREVDVWGDEDYALRPVGRVESTLTDRASAPRQGDEGAPSARIVFGPEFREAARDLRAGDEVLVLTWLHQGSRGTLSVHPRDDVNRPLTGVFSTRSPDRPNPIGLHDVTIQNLEEDAITVNNLEAIDGTPVIDIKPVLGQTHQR
jgi:tRNA-Thr(GGU) m(6)t(6)A37 methyltransferase TsaA